MTIEELLVRYGQNLNALKHKKACSEAKRESGDGDTPDGCHTGDKVLNGELEGEKDSNGKAGSGASKLRACRRGAAAAASGGPGDGKSSAGAGGGGGSSDSSGGASGGEKPSKVEGDAGPSCSSSAQPQAPGDTKSKFFEDSDESGEEEEEEEGSDEEVRGKGTPHQVYSFYCHWSRLLPKNQLDSSCYTLPPSFYPPLL